MRPSRIPGKSSIVSRVSGLVLLVLPLVCYFQNLPKGQASPLESPPASECPTLKRSKRWLEKAGARGNAEAMNQLGYMYMEGDDVRRNLVLAQQWLEKAAALGSACAMSNLGSLHYYDQGPRYNLSQAHQWFEKAASRGNAHAMNGLALTYFHDRDFAHTREWLEKALALGSADAMTNLCFLYQWGLGVQKDNIKAEALCEKGAALGSSAAMNNLAMLYYGPSGSDMQRGRIKTEALRTRAAARGSTAAMNSLSMIYYGPFEAKKDYAMAQYWFNRAAKSGNHSAMYTLGLMFDDGIGVPRDYKKARKWYEKSLSNTRFEESGMRLRPTYALGLTYEQGKGVRRNAERACAWYEKSAAFGNPQAMDRLARVYRDGLGVTRDAQRANFWQSRLDALQPPRKPLGPACMAADLDASVQVAAGPSSFYTLAFNYRNISGHDCVLEQRHPPSLVPDVFPNGTRVQLCDNCLEPVPKPDHPILSPPLLKKDEFAHLAFSWKTGPADETGPCLQPNWMSSAVSQDLQHAYLLVCPALLRRVCSPVQTGQYETGVFGQNSVPAGKEGVSLVLLQDSKTHYPGQQIEVAGSASEPGALLGSNQQTCPVVLQRTRSPEGDTRWDWLGNNWCKPEHIAGDGPNREVALRFDSGQDSRWGGLGDHSISLIQLLPPGENGEIRMVESNTVHLDIADNTTMPRRWGPQVKGIAVDVTLDNHTFELGEDIPLHIAMENFSADAPVVGPTPIWDAGFVVGIAVRDACQNPIKRSGGKLYTGHGRMLPYAKGVVVATERTLKNEGLLPAEPGTYSVTVTWCPDTCTGLGCGESLSLIRAPTYEHYAVVQDTETFEVVDPNHPQATNLGGTVGPCGRPGFEQVATSFGPYTALLDHATGLEWLHLDLTAGLSYSQVKKNLAAGGKFEGWRYATPAELQQFFADFDGSPDGYSTDRQFVSLLIKALGGPLGTFGNPSTGWHRECMEGLVDVPFALGHANYGYIAEDSSSGPVIDPKLEGSSRDDGAPYYIGSYLVRSDH